MEEHSTQKNLTQRKHELLAKLAHLPVWGKILFVLAFFIFLSTSFALIARMINSRLVEVPRHGGVLTEGIIGRPRFINPVIAKSDADRDMSALVYSGLLRPTTEGEIAPDLARDFEISDDGLTYTFTLKDRSKSVV